MAIRSASAAAVSAEISVPVLVVKCGRDGRPRALSVRRIRYGSAALPPFAMAPM